MIILRDYRFAVTIALAIILSGCASTMLKEGASTSNLMDISATSKEEAKNTRIQEVDVSKLLALIDQDLQEWEKDKSEVNNKLQESKDNLKWTKGLTWIGG